MVLIKKIRSDKISKGYRLQRSTHKLIDKLQKILLADQNEVITKACEMLYKRIKVNKTLKKKIRIITTN